MVADSLIDWLPGPLGHKLQTREQVYIPVAHLSVHEFSLCVPSPLHTLVGPGDEIL